MWQYNNFSPTGDLFKALDGTNSNLRYDVPLDQLQYYYKLEGAGSYNPSQTNENSARMYSVRTWGRGEQEMLEGRKLFAYTALQSGKIILVRQGV